MAAEKPQRFRTSLLPLPSVTKTLARQRLQLQVTVVSEGRSGEAQHRKSHCSMRTRSVQKVLFRSQISNLCGCATKGACKKLR